MDLFNVALYSPIVRKVGCLMKYLMRQFFSNMLNTVLGGTLGEIYEKEKENLACNVKNIKCLLGC